MNHDIIVIGGSLGSLDVLLEMVPSLPADLPAAVFIALHVPPGYASPLPELLSNRGPLPASHPLHDEPIENGHIYIAPADNHLLVRQGAVEVVRGPKENGHRPAVDALFRSASMSYGARVIGVVLSGHQDCGAAGLMSITARGGICVVQAPESARVDEMPRHAIDRANVDHIVQPRELASTLARLAAAQVVPERRPDPNIDQLEGREKGRPAELVCPLCSGVMAETEVGTFHHFRCHVGHTFTLDALAHEQDEAVERALWASVRALEESSALARRLAMTGVPELRGRFRENATTQAANAELIRNVLLGRRPLHAASA